MLKRKETKRGSYINKQVFDVQNSKYYCLFVFRLLNI